MMIDWIKGKLAHRARRSGHALGKSDHELEAEITEHRRAEQIGRGSEQQYRALFERTNDAVFILDLNGTHLEVNQKAAEMLGYTPEELVEMSFEQVVAPREYPYSRERLASLLDGQSLAIYERVFRRKDGSEFAGEVDVALVRDTEGNPLHIQSIVRDITERKRAEGDLRYERDLLNALLDNIPDTIYFKDTKSRFLRINRAQAEIMGIDDPDEATGKTDFDFFADDHARDAYADEQRILSSGQPMIDKIEKVTGLDGRWRWVSATKVPILDQEGQVTGLVGISRNITDRLHAEDALRESEERFRSIFENTMLGLYRTTPAGEILMANPALLRMLGYSSLEELARRNLEEDGYAPGYPRSVFVERMEQDGQVVGLESAWKRSDGATLYVRESAKAICDAEGNTLYYEGTVEDITERVQIEEALRASEARYRSLFEESPISLWEEDFSSVKQYIDDLRDQGVTDPAAYLVEHPEAVTRCADLVEIVDVNQETVKLFKAQSRAELFGGLDRVFTTESFDAFRDELVALVEGQTRFQREVARQTLTGESMSVILGLVVALGYEDSWAKVLVSMIDTTQRKQIEAEREQLLLDLMHRSNQLLTAAEVSKSAITRLDPEELIAETVNLIQKRFSFYYVGLFLVDEAGGYAVLHAGTGDPGWRMLQRGHKLAVGGDSMIGSCVEHAQARIALDVGREAVRFDNPYLPHTRSEMALPLISRGECIGALSVQSTEEAAFSTDDVATLQAMADQLAIAIANARLYDEVQRYATELEERVAERTAELAAVNTELEAFAYSVSHDLRAPLRSLDGFSQALLEDYGDRLDADGQDYLRRVRAGSQRMGQLIDDLLRLSRLTRRTLCRERIDLSKMARAVARELRRQEPERQVEFVIADGVFAEGDAHLLRVVLVNLLDNAWKFTSKHERARIEFGIQQREGEPTYFVQDDGAGFDMAYADKLFGAFQRLHGTVEFEGSGIGLATVQRIIHRHGGRLWAEGAAEKGATFYFTLASRRRLAHERYEG